MEASGGNAAGPTKSLESVQGHDHASEHQGLEAQNRNAPQPEVNPFMKQFLEIIQRVAPQPQPQPQLQPQDAVIDKNYEIVRRQGAKVFAGTTDPTEAEEWLRNTERVLDRIECTPEQRLRDCPTWRDNARGSQTSGSSNVGENSQRASTNRGRGRGGRGSGNISTASIGQNGQPQPQARVYEITKEQAPMAPEVVTGSFSICSSSAHVLIDPGSTCSFISHDFASRVHASIEPLGHDLCVSMPAGGVILVNTIARSCPIMVEGVTLYADLAVINLKEFDVILGWTG
ncbi:UNVERIFIED_CONTAM: hypothetical protein Sradi_6933800 [Sesamum radiatum]|uniref:Gag-pol polyprotein n=1 Tax=Sesamum radiatum TaxID=300843 RepID=A0AAW2JGJ9_SESRA